MKVYVAGASAEIERAEAMMALLRAAGIEVTSTWPETIRKVGAANPMGAPREDRAHWSTVDLDQVADANVFWFLLPKGVPTAGAYTEFGYAIMLASLARAAREAGVAIAPNYWIIASGTETSIFTALAQHFATDAEALDALKLRLSLTETLAKAKGPVVAHEALSDHSDGG